MVDTLGGSQLRGRIRPSRTYAAGRVCQRSSCSTKLSVYNRREFCSIHAPVKFPRVRGRIVPEA